jgi:hypothetical protein
MSQVPKESEKKLFNIIIFVYNSHLLKNRYKEIHPNFN